MNLYDLDEKLLNVWVAKAEGNMIATYKHGDTVVGYQLYFYSGDTPSIPNYCGDPKIGQLIIEDHGITTIRMTGYFSTIADHMWQASHPNLEGSRGGPTELIAAMRAYVASKFGNELADEI